MTCAHCEEAVVRALEKGGAHDARASHDHGEATFAGGDDSLMLKALRDSGYAPGPIELLDVPSGGPRGNGHGAFDLVVLGSGSAAFAAAIRASEHGARVAMVERSTVGGTCVNVGCVPSKALIRAAELQHAAATVSVPGLRLHADAPDLAQVSAWNGELVARLRQEKYVDLLDAYGLTLLRGDARFVAPDAVTVDGTLAVADHVLIATGASPAVPPIPGLAEAGGFLTNETIFGLDELPGRLIVLGGGPEGVEFGQAFARLGSKVTIVQRNRRLLPGEDEDVSAALAAALRGEGLDVLTETVPATVERRGSELIVHTSGRDEIVGDQILVATGRRPNTGDLDLAVAGIVTDGRGGIVVDEHLQTSNPRVFAAGDVTSSPQYVYVAAYQGALAADNALNGGRRSVDLAALPRVTFTSPQVAAVGLTEAAARAEGAPVKTSLLPIEAVPRAIVNGERGGLIKLVADAETDRLLGVHVVAENAGDVIQAGVLAVKLGLTVGDLVDTFHPYLTTVEGLRLAAQTFDRDVAKLSCCAA